MATHSSTLARKIPWMEEPGRLQSMGSQRVRHDSATSGQATIHDIQNTQKLHYLTIVSESGISPYAVLCDVHFFFLNKETEDQNIQFEQFSVEEAQSQVFYFTLNPMLCSAKLLQWCPTLCDSMDCSLPGFSVHGILQAGILEWVGRPSSRGSSQPRDPTHIS